MINDFMRSIWLHSYMINVLDIKMKRKPGSSKSTSSEYFFFHSNLKISTEIT